jgi:hypothetical protein
MSLTVLIGLGALIGLIVVSVLIFLLLSSRDHDGNDRPA